MVSGSAWSSVTWGKGKLFDHMAVAVVVQTGAVGTVTIVC